MAVIEYTLKENKTLGTHSWYLQAKSFSTLSCDDVAAEVVEGLGISPEMVPTIIKRYMRVVLRNVQRGHRVKLADELVIYPQISCSVKDELNPDGTVKKVATPDMINIQQAKSSIGATIAQSVQADFAKSVSWRRVNDDDTTGTGGNPDGGSTDDDGETTTGAVLTITKTGEGTMNVADESGHQVDSGSQVAEGQTLTLTVTPAEGQTPTAALNGTPVALTSADGHYTGTFQMPATASTLTVNTGFADGDNQE